MTIILPININSGNDHLSINDHLSRKDHPPVMIILLDNGVHHPNDDHPRF